MRDNVMKMIYRPLVVTLLLFGVVKSLSQCFDEDTDWGNWVSLVFHSSVLFLLLIKVKPIDFIIHSWSLIVLIGVGLVLMSQLLYLLSGASDKLSLSISLIGLLELVIFIFIFQSSKDNNFYLPPTG